MRLFVVIIEIASFHSEDYANLRLRLQVMGARRIMDAVYGLRCERTATELKEYFRKAIKPYDKIVVLEVASFASRRAAFDLGEL